MSILTVVMVVASVIMLALFIMLLVKMMNDNKGPADKTKTESHETEAPSAPAIPQVNGPAFVGMPLPDGAVAYLLNVGSSMQAVRDLAGLAIEDSTRRLEGRSYLVAAWVQDNTSIAEPKPPFPEKDLAKAGRDTTGLADWLSAIDPHAVADPARAAKEAASRGAAVLILITGNDVEAKTVDLLTAATAGKKVTWLAAVVNAPVGPIGEYPQLVRLTGDAKNVQRISADDLKAWLDKQTP
jgi:hypothetical protein